MVTKVRRAGTEIVFVNDVQHRMGRGNCQRVTRVGAAQPAGRGSVHHFRPTRDCRKRHPARQAFRHGDEIGLHAVVFHREQLAGAGEAGLDFVGNQQNPVGIAQGTQRLHKISGRDVKPALTLNRFKDNGRHLVWCDIRFENALQAF